MVRARVPGKLMLAMALSVGSSTTVVGQYQVNTQVNQNAYRLDANPQIGGSRFYDYGRPTSPLLAGNLLTSGNVRGGLSFRGFSPIGDPSGFRGQLGSGALSGFVRDSVSVADSQTPLGGLARQPFFDPTLTAPTVGYLQGQYAPQALRPSYLGMPSAGGARQPVPGQLDYRLPSAYDAAAAPAAPWQDRPSPLEVGADRSAGRGALSSRLFGVGEIGQDSNLDERFGAGRLRDVTRLPQGLDRGNYGPVDPRVERAREMEQPGARLDPTLADRLRLSSEPRGARIDQLLWGEAAPAPVLSRMDSLWDPAAAREASAPGGAGAEVATGAGSREGAGLPSLRATIVPGQDVFTDMQLAVALQRDPGAAWYTQMQQAISQDATLSARTREAAAIQATEFVGRVMKTSLKTFAGEGDTAVNAELRRAESFMTMGRYYDAADYYRRASLFDPMNPLPLVGRGHALLAAGDYLSSAVLLVQGLERFPELSRLGVDLSAMMGGGEIIDIRRADILRQLEQSEDARLRFLLGYLEYHGGMKTSGLENLKRAAATADPGSLIRRYPDMVEGNGLLPPPQVPTIDAPAVLPADPQPTEAGGGER